LLEVQLKALELAIGELLSAWVYTQATQQPPAGALHQFHVGLVQAQQAPHAKHLFDLLRSLTVMRSF